MVNINTISSKADNDTSIIVYDDVNNENITLLNSIFNNCNLYIDSKFPAIPNDIVEDIKRKGIKNYANNITAINQIIDLLNQPKICNKFTNSTQFNNFMFKVLYWSTKLFSEVLNNTQNSNTIFIDSELSKHEWIYVQYLSTLGIKIYIVNYNLDNNNSIDSCIKIKNIVANTHERKNYKKFQSIDEYNNLEELESALYEKNEVVRVIVSGVTTNIDAYDFYGKIFKNCVNNSDWLLYERGLDTPTYEQSCKIPRLALKNNRLILETLIKFLDIKDCYTETIKEAIMSEFTKENYSTLPSQQYYNKLVYSICVLNNTLNKEESKVIVLFNKIGNNNEVVLNILSYLKNIYIIILLPNKKIETLNNIEGFSLLELESSKEMLTITRVDTRDNASTLAMKAEKRLKDTLYSGDTLGMYRPGQFISCTTQHFSTTYDEIKNWWNLEMYLRPGFQSNSTEAHIKNMFKVIKGVPTDKKQKSYIEDIKKLAFGKTIVCNSVNEVTKLIDSGSNSITIKRCTDIRSNFSTQKPYFKDGKIDKDIIKASKNYKYSILSENKQDILLNSIENILTNNYIKTNDVDEFNNTVLSTLLNLNKTIVKYIQWFEYYSYNPNIIVINTEEKVFKIPEVILLTFLKLMGFDVLIYIPTCFNSIEYLITENFIYDEHIIGEATYEEDWEVDVYIENTDKNLETTQSTKHKTGVLNKLSEILNIN